MMEIDKPKNIWAKPWGFSESIAVVIGIIITGLSLEVAIGSFNFYLLSQPTNMVVAIVITIGCITLGLCSKKSHFARWFCSTQLSSAIIAALVLLSLIMGIIAQRVESNTLLGFDAMTSNWAFVLIYLMTLLSLGGVIVRRLTHFKIKDYSFYLNHIGLWLLLLVSALGYADMQRYIMYVEREETQWRVYDDKGEIIELPIAIKLNDFSMEVYAPKLAIIDRSSGEILPLGSPKFIQLDKKELPHDRINGWDISVKEYLHNAIRNSDSTYRSIPIAGSTPAAYIEATKDGVTKRGWICSGSRAQMYMTMPLDEEQRVVMTTPEPRIFCSQVDIYTQSGAKKSGAIEVNHPLSIDNWMIYQYGYDNEAGNLSSYSSFELVYDPYIRLIYLSIALLFAGSFCMLWSKKERRL